MMNSTTFHHYYGNKYSGKMTTFNQIQSFKNIQKISGSIKMIFHSKDQRVMKPTLSCKAIQRVAAYNQY